MKTQYLSWKNQFTIPRLYLLTIAAVFIAIHLFLHIKLDKYPHLAISVVFWLAALSLLQDKSKEIKLGSDANSSLLGGLIIATAILISLFKPGVLILGFFPFIALFGLALLASSINGLIQYRQELIIFFTLGLPRIFLPLLPDISTLTAKFSTFLLWFFSFPVTLEGQYISLPKGGVEVVPACSGLNLITYMLGLSVISLVAFSTKSIRQAKLKYLTANNNTLTRNLLPESRSDHREKETAKNISWKYKTRKTFSRFLTNKISGLRFGKIDFWYNNWEKFTVPIVAIIIGFIVNAIRVALLAIFSSKLDEKVFDYWHSQEGALIFVVISVILFGLFYSLLIDWTTSSNKNFKSSLKSSFNRFFYNKLSMKTIQTKSKKYDSYSSSLEKSRSETLEGLGTSWLQSLVLIRYAGYGLLLLAFFDFMEIIFSFNLMNSGKIMEVFGQFIERIPVPLIGLVLVSYGGKTVRYKIEESILLVLSWLSLLIAISLFLLMPLSIADTIHTDRFNGMEFDNQKTAKIAEVELIEKNLEQVTTQVEVRNLLSYFEDVPEEISESSQSYITQEEAGNIIDSGKKNIIKEINIAKTQQRQMLIKSSVKWNLGALISGALFILIWQGTSWMRE